MSVSKRYGVREKVGQVGVEIECEGKNLFRCSSPVWKTENDGSLRNGVEYVLTNPILARKVKEAVEVLIEEGKLNSTIFDFSHRTSVHVHVNVSDINMSELRQFVYVASFLDAFLSKVCKREIKGNRFALRISDASYAVNILNDFFREDVVPREEEAKYASINLCPIRRYGSVEFRSMHGNMDAEYISKWCQLLWSIRERSRSFTNMREIYLLACNHPDKFLSRVIHKDLLDYFKYDGMEYDVHANLSMLAEFQFLKHKEQ